MNLRRFIPAVVVLAFVTAGLSSCLSEPEYSTTPAIRFKELRKTHVNNPGGVLDEDTLAFVIEFEDGDGDLGLTADEVKLPPYQQPGRSGYNYFIKPFQKNPATGRFEEFVSPSGGTYDSYFNLEDLNLDYNKPAPLTGTIVYKLLLTLSRQPDFEAGQEYRFEISIMDRAFHESNKITTSSVVLGP